jgi:hypothetical protein
MLRLRSGPQDLPSGSRFAISLAAAWLALGLLTSRALNEPDALPRSLLPLLVQLGAVVVLLNTRRLGTRIPQTISALAGTGIILGLLALPLLLGFDASRPQPGLALAYLGLFLWSLAVDGHIYRHALSITMGLGVLVAVLIFGANLIIMRVAFG